MDTQMNTTLIVSILVITLLNLGLVVLALNRLNGLRRDLRTPVVKKYNPDYNKRKSVDIPKMPDNFGKNQRDDKSQGRNQQPLAQNRNKNNSQQSRPMQIRRPAVKVPDVFSNEAPAAQAPSIPSRSAMAEQASAAEGRRPLPPRFNAAAPAAPAFGTAPADLAPPAAPASSVANDGEDSGMEFDRTKMAHGRRNVVAKPIIEDDEAEKSV